MADGASLSVSVSLLFDLSQEDAAILTAMEQNGGGEIDFAETWRFADIVFVVEGRQLHANKTILSLWSPVFDAMLQGHFREKEAEEIRLPGKSFSELLELMRVLHPPNADICENNVEGLLSLAEEYQMAVISERCEEFLLTQASSLRNFSLALKYNLSRLHESTLAYMRRVPVVRLKQQAGFEKLDQQVLLDVLMSKCEKLESHLDELREVRMVLERKKPTTFPGVGLLCPACVGARESQVHCATCSERCCKRITDVLRKLEQ